MRRSSIFSCVVLALGCFALGATASSGQQASDKARATAHNACHLEHSGDVSVIAIIDGRTFAIASGRQVRLVGLELPQSAAPAAKTALATLIEGKTVTLKRAGAAEDRYGRVLAYVFAANDGEGASIQAAMLSSGHALAAARAGATPCATSLLAAEAEARAAGRGLWGEPQSRPKSAEMGDEILRERGRFAVVEGKVLSVRDAGGITYVNFGRNWSRDFTVTILRRNVRAFAAAGIAPKRLEGQRVRVRGVIEVRNGPVVEAVTPEQIEIIR